MNSEGKAKNLLYYILIWGALWGIFEATVGYLLHLLPFSIGWLVWYPVACFFMANVYRVTNKISSVVLVGILCSSIKLLNLMLPVRIDRVINPSVSIAFEAFTMASILFLFQGLKQKRSESKLQKSLMIFSMNTSWRLLYILYLLFIVPDWMREISVVANTEKLISFFVTQNLITSMLITIGYHFQSYLLKPILFFEGKINVAANKVPFYLRPVFRAGTVFLLFGITISLEFLF